MKFVAPQIVERLAAIGDTYPPPSVFGCKSLGSCAFDAIRGYRHQGKRFDFDQQGAAVGQGDQKVGVIEVVVVGTGVFNAAGLFL